MATQGAQATGVITQSGKFIPADYVVLAAGGFSTPVILQNSNIPCGNSLFVDPVLCVAAEVEGVLQNKGVSMPFAAQKEHFILSPYFDYLSFFFNKAWKKPAQNILPLMIKLADETTGGVDKAHAKHLTDADKQHLKEGADICKEVLLRFGARKESIFMGTINAGHPGGMLPLTPDEAETLHNPRLPGNLYVADATLFPKSLGNPPILTVMALATKAARLIFLSN